MSCVLSQNELETTFIEFKNGDNISIEELLYRYDHLIYENSRLTYLLNNQNQYEIDELKDQIDELKNEINELKNDKQKRIEYENKCKNMTIIRETISLFDNTFMNELYNNNNFNKYKIEDIVYKLELLDGKQHIIIKNLLQDSNCSLKDLVYGLSQFKKKGNYQIYKGYINPNIHINEIEKIMLDYIECFENKEKLKIVIELIIRILKNKHGEYPFLLN